MSCKQEVADLIVINSNTYTVNNSFDKAEAFAVKDGKFIAIGTNGEIQKKYKAFLEVLECKNVIDSKEKLMKRRTTVNELVTCMGKANTIYHAGRLHDCDNDATEEAGTKIILGRTNIGNLN